MATIKTFIWWWTILAGSAASGAKPIISDREDNEMRHLLKWTVISVVLASSLGPAIAQNTPSPKPEDTEKNAFETPTAGKSATDTLKNTKDQSSDRNPESRLNDDRQPPEGSPKRPEK